MGGGTGPLLEKEKPKMKKAVYIAGTIVAAIALTATATLAVGPGAGWKGDRMSFQELDIDGDGQITKPEMQAAGDARHSRADRDGNGTLSAAELEAQGHKRVTDRVAKMIEKFDKDGDGALSQAEMPKSSRQDRMFGFLDEDGSGGVSEQEFAEAGKGMRPGMKMRPGMFGHWGMHQDQN